jgi:Flp pilus assembly protein TadB
MTVLVAVLAAATVAVALPPVPRLPRSVAAPPVRRDDRAPLDRWRVPLAVLTGAGVGVFLGGAAGIAAGLLAGAFAWRVLGRVESPAAVRRREALARDLPGAVDLLVAAFAAGVAPGPALGLVADALDGPVSAELGALHRRLDLGADPASLWSELAAHPQLAPLGRALARAHDTGASVTTAGARLARELRERARAEVESRARSVSTRAAAPLGMCFLPAFVLLGIVPLVAGLVGSLGLLR